MLTVIQPSLLDDTTTEYTVARTVQAPADETVPAPIPVLPGQLPLFEDGTL